MENSPPLLVILGPTASGKSSLGLEVARELHGEIISADAFAVYRGMDIGTDKAPLKARKEIPHHLIDILEPEEVYSAGQFAERAFRIIEDCRGRNVIPIVVGGTHFYIKALIHGLFPSPEKNPDLRRRLEESWRDDPDALWRELLGADPVAAHRIGSRDRQRILRALELFRSTGKTLDELWKPHRMDPRFRPLYIAPLRPRAELYARIERRVDSMFVKGFVEEVHAILERGTDPKTHALKAIGYRELVEVILRGEKNFDETIEKIKRSSRRFAKRQLTWLRHHQGGGIHWVAPREENGTTEVLDLWRTHLETA